MFPTPAARSLLLACCLLAAGATAGCGDSGAYEIRWSFRADGTFQEGDCGAHGVSSFEIGARGPGDDLIDDLAVAPCAPGSTRRRVPPGDWVLTVRARDGDGGLKVPLPEEGKPVCDGANAVWPNGNGAPPLLFGCATVSVGTDGVAPTSPAVVVLPPLPDCRDGVDNDHDGRVDADDPECRGTPDGVSECGPSAC